MSDKETENRRRALEHAVGGAFDSAITSDVVDRAQAYFDFLSGEPKAAKPNADLKASPEGISIAVFSIPFEFGSFVHVDNDPTNLMRVIQYRVSRHHKEVLLSCRGEREFPVEGWFDVHRVSKADVIASKGAEPTAFKDSTRP